ncbi:MAG: alpha/beta fold hydrolase [Pseudonocardiaceae bacterium]
MPPRRWCSCTAIPARPRTGGAWSPAPAPSPARWHPDPPGYGGADKPDRFDYTVDGYARHLGGILDQIDVHRAHLVLHDFGGAWSLAWPGQPSTPAKSPVTIVVDASSCGCWSIDRLKTCSDNDFRTAPSTHLR